LNERESPPELAVVIATRDRSDLLSQRALASVTAQTRGPDYLVVVDDSSPDVRPRVSDLISALHLPSCGITYIENTRTEGASGSWNTALDFLVGKGRDPSNVFVAILDDDDSWSPEYLEMCYATACDQRLDMVAADLRRFESVDGQPVLNEAPAELRAEDFLTGNPGIQGSNLFVRLSVLLAAGGFDEALRSTTDRDLCIRIADLSTVRYGRLPVALVDHFAAPGRSRLSTRGSPAKAAGLTALWLKYVGRMTASQRQAFSDRAAALFDWRPPSNAVATSPSLPEPFGKAPAHPPLRMYVGVITSDPAMLKPLLDGLTSLASGVPIQWLGTLVLDNGSSPDELDAMVRLSRAAGLPIAVVDEAQQRRDAAGGAFGSGLLERPQGQVGIARARTMLQRYLASLLDADTGSFGWVLDDDMRVDARACAYLPWLPAFRAEGTDALIGATEGVSPNPPLNGLRVHLVDLFHNMHWLRNMPENALFPDRTVQNEVLRTRYPDYYYDLSRQHTGHLEMPHWLEPAAPGETVRAAYSRLIDGAVGILNGAPLTRPVIATPPVNPLAAAKDSVNRGGCTFILNHRSLSQTPNTITTVQGREARRSDMVWAIVNRHYRRMNIKAVAFSVHHVGRVNASPSLNIEKVQAEIIGSTLYAGLTEFLRTRPHNELAFSREEAVEVCRLADLHLERRWRQLGQSFHRIAGLRGAIRSLAEPGELRDLLRHLDDWFTPGALDVIRSGVGAHEIGHVREFLTSLRAVADDYAEAIVDVEFIQTQLAEKDRDGKRGPP
jgi:GT2 family glycosyltransferase